MNKVKEVMKKFETGLNAGLFLFSFELMEYVNFFKSLLSSGKWYFG